MRVHLERTHTIIDIPACADASALLAHLSLREEDVIIAVNGAIVLPDTTLHDDDEVHILSVISGG